MIEESLRQAGLFRELDQEELTQVLLVGLIKSYPAGSTILTEGAAGGQLHVIQEGRVRISKTIPGFGEEALAILGPGDVFGEIEFFDGAPSSAFAIAHSDCRLLAIPHGEVRALMERRPLLAAKFLWAFARTLATRLRETDQKLATLVSLTRL